MHKVLVTGSNGQLGNAIRDIILSYPLTDSYYFTDVAELDITDREAIRAMVASEHIDVVVNCAAYTNVDKAEEDKYTADRINHQAVEHLAVAAREAGAALIHISTDYVFGGDKNTPCREDWETDPLGVYGRTKLLGEEAIRRSGCKFLIFRTAWLYSAYGNNYVKTMLRLIAERHTLKVVFDQVGTPTYAGDLAALIVYLIDTGQMNKEGIYHYSNEGVCSWYDFAKEIAALAGHNGCDIQPCHSDEFPSRVKRPHFSVLDKTKVKKTFEITIPYWKDSLKQCLEQINRK